MKNSQAQFNSQENNEEIEMENRKTTVQNVTKSILERLEDFHDLLKNPPKVGKKNVLKFFS